MTLPDGVSIKKEGTIEFVTQRGYWTPPYRSCMFGSLCSVLEWMGYDLPLNRTLDSVPPDNFVHLLHVNSGRPLTSGTTTADTKKALLVTFGQDNLPKIKYGLLPDDVLLEQLQGNWAVRITAKMGELPRYLRRWCGYGFTGRHAMALLDARQRDGVWEVFLSDPMGRPSKYSGEWVAYDTIKHALSRTDGRVQVTIGEWNTAFEFKPPVIVEPEPVPPIVVPMPPEVIVEPVPPVEEVMPMIVRGVRNEFIPVTKGTAFLRPDNLQVVTRAAVNGDFRCVGRSEDGKYVALQVRTLKIPGGLSVLFADAAKVGAPVIKPC